MALSRRMFVAGAAASAMAATVAMADEAQPMPSWDAEYDVVVVGYGASGAVAAIEAADNGAHVLLVEKAPQGHEGGCSKACQQLITCTPDPEAFFSYYDVLRGGFSYPSDELLRVYTDGAARNWDYLAYLGAPQEEIDFKQRGADIADAPYADSVYVTCVTSSYYLLLQDNIEKRSDAIDVWFESPATKLVLDPATREVLGVEVQRDGQPVNVRSKGGVVLGSGGFEGSQEMVEAFLWATDTGYTAGGYNTGDGLRMTMGLGADLVNMGVANAFSWGFRYPGERFSYTVASPVNNHIVLVDQSGKRFYNERQSARRGNLNFSGNWRVPGIFPDYAWFVFDEDTRTTASVVVPFSEGNADEVADGTILRGETLEELADAMGVPAENLVATIEAYNEACETGQDRFGRAQDRMKPVVASPFYALKMSKVVVNTEGGPKRDVCSRPLDVEGNPIPGLFTVGALGCPNIGEDFNCGSNMCESIVFGRIAGCKAACAAAGGDLVSAQPLEIPAHEYEIPEA